jgi:hypothetical protein
VIARARLINIIGIGLFTTIYKQDKPIGRLLDTIGFFSTHANIVKMSIKLKGNVKSNHSCLNVHMLVMDVPMKATQNCSRTPKV